MSYVVYIIYIHMYIYIFFIYMYIIIYVYIYMYIYISISPSVANGFLVFFVVCIIFATSPHQPTRARCCRRRRTLRHSQPPERWPIEVVDRNSLKGLFSIAMFITRRQKVDNVGWFHSRSPNSIVCSSTISQHFEDQLSTS